MVYSSGAYGVRNIMFGLVVISVGQATIGCAPIIALLTCFLHLPSDFASSCNHRCYADNDPSSNVGTGPSRWHLPPIPAKLGASSTAISNPIVTWASYFDISFVFPIGIY